MLTLTYDMLIYYLIGEGGDDAGGDAATAEEGSGEGGEGGAEEECVEEGEGGELFT